MDTELRKTIELAVSGDEQAFASLIFSVQNKAYAMAYRYMGSDADTRDVMQEAFIKMYRYLGTFQGESSFETWFFRILINCCLDELRKRKHAPDQEDIAEHYEIADSADGAEELLIRKERQKAVRKAIAALPEDAKNIIILRELQGLSYEELAEVLDIEAGTVKSRLNRAKQKLKAILLEQNALQSV